MEIIKDAFIEGRETEVSWEKSESKKKSVKAEIALENLSLMKKREFGSVMPLERICPETGRVLETYPSRLAAARWIVDNVLKNPNKNPLSITGNMEMSMRCNFKAYGYYWKLVDGNRSNVNQTAPNSKKVFAMGKLVPGAGLVYSSIGEAARAYDVSEKVVRNRIKGVYSSDGVQRTGQLGFAEEYNPTKRVKKFSSIAEAARTIGINERAMRKWAESGKYINNTKYVVESLTLTAPKPKYILYKGKKKVGEYATSEEVSKVVGLHRTTVVRRIKNNELIGIYRVVMK